jgi:serine/threonine protein kinase
MSEDIVDNFLAVFDDSRYPSDFLQHYELMECLAHNELGETLLVRDLRTDELYVAKCYVDQSLLPRTSESSLLRNFHHEGLPAFIGEYRNDTMLCVVRDYIEGMPLEKLERKPPFSLNQALSIVVQLCDILTYLHSQNPPIIHRDIKPQNIIVNNQGKITLIDFGVSRTYDESARQDTVCFGTRHYAAPEQYGFAQTDQRTDIFSVGVLLAWLLTGSNDIEQAKTAISNRRMLGIIEKCTAFDPKDRYKNALQLKDALTGRQRRRRRIGLVALAGLLVVATALLFQRSTRTIHFNEPVIEDAVRLSLGLEENAKLTEADLLAVNQLFILGNQAAPDYMAFNDLVDEFAHGNGSLPRGDIESLDDLTRLKNLRNISLAYQTFSDLSPLAELPNLEIVDIRNNPQVSDISPLAGSVSLTSLTIFDTSIASLSALRDCPRLSQVDAGMTLIDSMDALEGLDALKILMLRKAPLRSLDGIADHPLLESLHMSETQVTDLSPLLALPHLQTVEISQDMRSAAEAVEDQASFDIIYN